MDYMEQERLKDSDLVGNATPPVLACICVDASYSMIGERINHVNKGISDFISKGANDPYARDSLQVCIIAFNGDGPQMIQPFMPVYKCNFSPIHTKGDTPLGAAVLMALDEISACQERNESRGVIGHKPWLILMTDGDATDNLFEAERRVRESLSKGLIKVKCIGLGDNNGKGYAELARFSPNGKVQTCDALKIENFFSMLSRSAVSMSCSAPGEDDYDFPDEYEYDDSGEGKNN